MTVLPSASVRTRGPIEGEGPEQPGRSPSHVGQLNNDQSRVFNVVKEWLKQMDVNDEVLVEVIKNYSSNSLLSAEAAVNDIVSNYLDRIERLPAPQTDSNRAFKQVRFDQHFDVPTPAPSVNRPSSFSSCGTSTDKAAEVVDLTMDDDRGTSKWRENSVLGSREEQDMINRAIEESLKDNQNIPGYAPFAQKDPENPHDRCRADLTPVGLKNIGNSCWFNVIAQTLVHIPQFRQLLFDFVFGPPYVYPSAPSTNGWTSEASSSSRPGATPVSLLNGLRYLSAFLVGSNRAYVDPTDVLTTISDLNASLNKAVPCIGIQQDATEMLLRLIEWLEQAFKGSSRDLPPAQLDGEMEEDETMTSSALDTSSDAITMPDGNLVEAVQPVISLNSFNKLFHGSHIEIRQATDGSLFSTKLDNSVHLVNLDISFDNLHDSLEAYHFGDSPTKEIWFETLPPVVVFSLVRFNYKNGQTEKVHSKFHFPSSFYMDRYLHRNREAVIAKRNERTLLRQKLSAVRDSLGRLEKYPVGVQHETVPNILTSTLQLIASMSSGFASNMELGSNVAESMDTGDISSGTVALSSDQCEGGEGNGNSTSAAIDLSTVPLNFQMNIVTVLKLLADNAQAKIDALQKEANELKEQVDGIFTVDGMMQESYRLHSVLIHEGEANVGHYWAYIADHSTLDESGSPIAWRKFNDRNVEPATWQQIEEDSFGSRRTCSAYCLVYTRKLDERPLFAADDACVSASTVADLVETLPVDLVNEVKADNESMIEELAKWDAEHVAIPLGPINKPPTRPLLDPEIIAMLSGKDAISINVEIVKARHCEKAYQNFGSFILTDLCERIRAGMPESQFWEHDESIAKLLNEAVIDFDNLAESAVASGGLSKNANKLTLLPEWTRLNAVPLSVEAQRLYLLRVFAVSPKLKFSSLCLTKANELVLALTENAADELEDALVLHELFGQAVAILSDVMKKFFPPSSSQRSPSSLKLDVSLTKLLCAAIRRLDRVHGFGRHRFPHVGRPPLSAIELASYALLFYDTIKITKELIREIQTSRSDEVIAKYDSFLQKEYRALLVRVNSLRCDASKETIEYITSLWNKLISSSDGVPKIGALYQVVIDAAEQLTVCDIPSVPVKVEMRDLGLDLGHLSTSMDRLTIRNENDLKLFVHNTIMSSQVPSPPSAALDGP